MSIYRFIVPILIFSLCVGVGGAEDGRFVEDVRGRKFRCGAYDRIVSLAPNITEILFFVGAENRLIGVTRFCNYPREAKRIEKVGGLYDPDLEKIMALNPDLVLATKDGNPRHVVNFLESAGIPSFVTNPRNMGEILTSIESIACVAGGTGEVAERIDTLREKLTQSMPSPGENRVRILFLLSQTPMIAAGKGTFIDEMIIRAGGVNVASDLGSSYPRFDIENVLSLEPDIVFWVPSMGGASGKGQLERVQEIIGSDAIELVPVDSDVFTRPGPRLFEGMATIEKVVKRVQ